MPVNKEGKTINKIVKSAEVQFLPSDIAGLAAWYDLSLKDNSSGTRSVVDDLSGNGRNLTLSNFAYDEADSGYHDGALYFDGVDDFLSGPNPTFNNLSDFTIFFKRKFLYGDLTSSPWCVASYGATWTSNMTFLFEYHTSAGPTYFEIGSLGDISGGIGRTQVPLSSLPDLVSYMAPASYNGSVINKGDVSGDAILYIGKTSSTGAAQYRCCKMALYEVVIYDRTLGQDEIDIVKSYLNNKDTTKIKKSKSIDTIVKDGKYIVLNEQPETISILNRYSSDVSGNMKNALNEFIYRIKAAGIYEKLSTLVLPFLGANLAEAGINALTGESAFLTNLNSLSLTNGGLKPIDGMLKATMAMLGERSLDLHMAAYNITPDNFYYFDDNGTTKRYGSNVFTPFINGVYSLGKHNTNGSSMPSMYTSGSIASGSTNNAEIPGFILGNLTNTDNTLCINNEISTRPIGSATDGPIDMCRFGAYNNPATYTRNFPVDGQSWGYTDASWSFMSFGKALTEDQMLKYNKAVDSLMESVAIFKPYRAVVPVMSSNTTPAPFVANANSIASAAYDAWYAFGPVNTSPWITLSNQYSTTTGLPTGTPSYIQIDLGAGNGKKICRLGVFTRSSDGGSVLAQPNIFEVSGSNDGSNFTLIKRFEDVTYENNRNDYFDWDEPDTAYRYWRITILKNNLHTAGRGGLSNIQYYTLG